MARSLREYNLGHEGSLAQVAQVLTDNGALYRSIDIRCVAHLNNNKWENAICVIRGLPSSSASPALPERMTYPKLKFLQRQMSVQEFAAFLRDFKTMPWKFGEDAVELNGGSLSLNSYEFLGSENDYSAYPGVFYEASRQSVNLSQEPLLDYNARFYASPYHAVRDWVGIRGFHADRDGRMGAVLMFLPECRARFSALECKAGVLRVSADRSAGQPADLKVTGQIRTDAGAREVNEVLGQGVSELKIEGQVQSLELYLLGSDNTIYDLHLEDTFHSRGHRRVLVRDEEREPDDSVVDRARQSGESETLEFKPYIELGHPKMDEVVEAVCAFANTKGGTLIFGMNDHCGVDGIEKSIQHGAKKASRTASEFLEQYIGAIRQKVAGTLNRVPQLTFVERHAEGHTVLTLAVPEGPQKPYFNLHTKQTFIRRGANNVVADPERDLPSLTSRQPNLANIFG